MADLKACSHTRPESELHAMAHITSCRLSVTAQAPPNESTASAARQHRKEGRVQRRARARQTAAVEAAPVPGPHLATLGQGPHRVAAPPRLQGAALRVAAQPHAASELIEHVTFLTQTVCSICTLALVLRRVAVSFGRVVQGRPQDRSHRLVIQCQHAYARSAA